MGHSQNEHFARLFIGVLDSGNALVRSEFPQSRTPIMQCFLYRRYYMSINYASTDMDETKSTFYFVRRT